LGVLLAAAPIWFHGLMVTLKLVWTFVLTSIDVVYGESASGDFRRLCTVLVKSGRLFPDAVKEILDGQHGPYYHWGEAFLQLDAEYTAQLKMSFGVMKLESMTLDDAADLDR
jgi:hypothetical protein